jgi:dipeptidyl aminopeptidase/acylaminoacyl peptidase
MEDGLTHDPSKTNLFGHNLTSQKRQRFVEYFSLEKHVNHLFPPVFMFHTKDDAVVSVENTYRMVDALEKAKVSKEQKGGL